MMSEKLKEIAMGIAKDHHPTNRGMSSSKQSKVRRRQGRLCERIELALSAERNATIEECVKVMHSISTPDDKDIDIFIEQFPGEICREQAVVFMIQNATEISFDALKED